MQSPTSHHESPQSTSSDDAELEHYILQAEIDTIERPGESYPRKKVFTRTPSGTTPLLRKGRRNRIIIYPGCFNPPHRDHRRVLMHGFFYTDRRTVAALIVPIGDHRLTSKQRDAEEPLVLTTKQRRELWHDDLLNRFSWVFPGCSTPELTAFMKKILRLARQDGYPLEFAALGGSDHIDMRRGTGDWTWGTGIVYSSDITRPAAMMSALDTTPRILPGVEEWRKILPHRSGGFRSRHDCLLNERSCWSCPKFKAVYPELATMEVFQGAYNAYELTKTSFQTMNPELLQFGLKRRFAILTGDVDSGPLQQDMLDVLQCCHVGRGVVWKCDRKHARYSDQEFLLFLPSGRNYANGPERESISSTIIRQVLSNIAKESTETSILFKTAEATYCQGTDCELADGEVEGSMDGNIARLSGMTLKAPLLLTMTGLHDCWPFDRPVEPSVCFPCQHWKDWDWSFVGPVVENMLEGTVE